MERFITDRTESYAFAYSTQATVINNFSYKLD